MKHLLIAGLKNFAAAPETMLEASGVSAAAPLENLRRPRLFEPTVFEAAEKISLRIHYGGTLERISFLGLFDHDLGRRDEVKVDLFAEANPPANAVPIRSTGWLPAWAPYQSDGLDGSLDWGEADWSGEPPAEVLETMPRHVLIPFYRPAVGDEGDRLDEIAHRSIRVRVRGDVAARSIAYLDLGRAWSPATNFDWNWSFDSLLEDDDLPRRRLRFSFPLIEERDVARLVTFHRTFGGNRPLVVIPTPGDPTSWWEHAGLYRLDQDRALERDRLAVPGKKLWKIDQLQMIEWTENDLED